MPVHKLQIELLLWLKMIEELKKRGNSKFETGAFLLGNSEEKKVTNFICFDDLDPTAYEDGIIVFKSAGYTPLWEYCKKNNLTVLADVHTHPSNWTGQSTADMNHPMIAMYGHIALIVPQYATKKNQLLNGVGVYEYLGGYKWKTYKKHSQIINLIK